MPMPTHLCLRRHVEKEVVAWGLKHLRADASALGGPHAQQPQQRHLEPLAARHAWWWLSDSMHVYMVGMERTRLYRCMCFMSEESDEHMFIHIRVCMFLFVYMCALDCSCCWYRKKHKSQN